MRIKSGFVLHSIGDQFVVVPVGERTKEFSGMINLNGSGAFLWKQMENDFTKKSLLDAMLKEYDVDEATANKAIDAFVGKLTDAKIIEE